MKEKREEEKRKKKKRRREGERSSKKVWKLTLIMNSMRLCMNFHAWLVSSCPQTWGFTRVSS